MKSPNVLFVTFDQWRADCSPCAQTPRVTLPNVERVAQVGVRFTQHFANAVPCGPARAGLYTGTYLHHHRSVGNGTPLSSEFVTLGQVAQNAGYAPIVFGYTDTSLDPRGREPGDPALHTYESVLPGFAVGLDLDERLVAWGAWLRDRGYTIGDDVRGIYDAAVGNCAAYSADHTEAAFLTETFLTWLGNERDRAPFFAHLSYIKPHPPYAAPAEYLEQIDPNSWTEIQGAARREQEAAQHPLVAAAQALPETTFEDESHLRDIRQAYRSNLLDVDTQFGRVLDHLQQIGQLENTIIVLTADHGDLLGDHHAIEKWGHFPSAYHVPLIIAGPPVHRHHEVTAFTEHVDVLPTLCDLLGVPTPSQCDGRSLRTFLDTPHAPAWREAAHWEWDFRDPRHHLAEEVFDLRSSECNVAVIHDHAGTYAHYAGLPPVFYDALEDPNESRNAAADPRHQASVAAYASRLLSWRLGSDDQRLANTLLATDGPFHLPT